jgi:hypothetical protein
MEMTLTLSVTRMAMVNSLFHKDVLTLSSSEKVYYDLGQS